MGELLSFPSRDRACHGPARKPPFMAAPIAIADLVFIAGETLPCGGPQSGVVNNIVITPDGVRLWVRRHGGPLAGATRVVALTEARLAPFPPPSHG